LIGVRVALADGTIAKGGGKVVKNVAGYDLPKLYTGALGTLGVILTATFRLYPLPVASRTVVFASFDLPALCDFAQRVTASTLVPTLLDLHGAGTGINSHKLVARFECLPEAADDQAARLLDMAGSLAEAPLIAQGDEEASFWRLIDAAHLPITGDERSLTLKASLLPTAIAPWLTQLRDTARAHSLDPHWRAHAGHGIVFARLTGDPSALVAVVEPLRAAAHEQQGSLVVMDAAPALAAQLDPWGPSPALALMRRLKDQFDPTTTLNPGRFIGRI
jgi:glycolate oxidase FAD binding subunit